MKKSLALVLMLPFMLAAGDDCSSGCSGTTDPDCKQKSETLKLSGIWQYQRDTAGGLSKAWCVSTKALVL